MMPFILSALWALLMIESAGYAEVYKYKDENGNWKFTDTPPAYNSESIQRLNGMAASSPGSRDINKELYSKFPPQNKIEEASLSAVTITSDIGTGSGFFVTANGYILTNKHVIRGDENQKEKTEEVFNHVDSELERVDSKVALEEQRLDQAGEYLDKMKQELDDLPDGSSQKQFQEQKYESDMEYYTAWKERFERQKERYENGKQTYAGQKTDYDSKMVMAGTNSYFKITLKNGDELDAQLVRASQEQDLALLKINGYVTPFVQPANNPHLAQGQAVYAIGSPINLSDSVSRGIVSGFRDGYIQTDAKVYPGNSGGPLITEDGRVVGINTMKELTHNFEGLGFAIPIQAAIREFEHDLKADTSKAE